MKIYSVLVKENEWYSSAELAFTGKTLEHCLEYLDNNFTNLELKDYSYDHIFKYSVDTISVRSYTGSHSRYSNYFMISVIESEVI